jgi:hypothetical protein
MARAASKPSNWTKSVQSANFRTIWLGTLASCFLAVLESSTFTGAVYPKYGYSQRQLNDQPSRGSDEVSNEATPDDNLAPERSTGAATANVSPQSVRGIRTVAAMRVAAGKTRAATSCANRESVIGAQYAKLLRNMLIWSG